jgi:hypothetical protein
VNETRQPRYWSISAQDPLFDELRRQELRLLDAARELDPAAFDDAEAHRPYFEAVLAGVVVFVLLPALLVAMAMMF